MRFFQTLSRPSDTSGNPYRLYCVYDYDAELVHMAENRLTSQNYVRVLKSLGLKEIMPLDLLPRQYALIKQSWARPIAIVN